MKILFNLMLVILVLLAISSGVTKIALMPQDVAFFGKYGFTHPILIAYGAVQLVGGVLLAIRKTRSVGALVVALTFLISLIVLLLEGNFAVAAITLVCIALLGLVFKQPFKSAVMPSDQQQAVGTGRSIKSD